MDKKQKTGGGSEVFVSAEKSFGGRDDKMLFYDAVMFVCLLCCRYVYGILRLLILLFNCAVDFLHAETNDVSCTVCS